MSSTDLQGKRILVTQATEFMGPVLCQVLAEHGATVLTDHSPMLAPDEPARVIAAHGHVDVLLINLAYPAPNTLVNDVEDSEWRAVFEHLVDPLPRLVRAVLPQMKARGRGKVLLMGSASALRGMPRSSTYCAARGAQLSWVQAAGIEPGKVRKTSRVRGGVFAG